MKKILLVFLLALTCFFAGCNATEKPIKEAGKSNYYVKQQEGYIFEIGEKVEIYEKTSQKHVCSLVIKNAMIISGESKTEETSYGELNYSSATVQVNYETQSYIHGFSVDSYDLKANDVLGMVAEQTSSSQSKYTKYEMVEYAVKNAGDYLDIGICIDSDEPIGVIRAYYDVGEIEEDPFINKVLYCVIVLFAVLLVILVVSYRKIKSSRTLLLAEEKELEGIIKKKQDEEIAAGQQKTVPHITETNTRQTEENAGQDETQAEDGEVSL